MKVFDYIQRYLITVVVNLSLSIAMVHSVLGATQPVYFSNLTTRNGLPSNITNSIVQDKHGFIWMGTQEGLCRYDGFKMTVFQDENSSSSITSNNISSLLYDEDLIWIGTWDGLNTIDIHTFEVKQVHTGDARVIRVLYKDQKDNIWIGTSNGLLVYNKSTDHFSHYHTANSNLSHNTIRSIYQSQNGDMWIGTYDGLNRYRNDEFTRYNLKGDYKPLLENNLIVSIQPYQPGNDSLLWVGTETGLARFNTQTGNFSLFNTSNTALSNEVIKHIYHQNDTLLWLATDFGLNVFNTKTYEISTWYHDPLIDHTIASNVIWEIFEDQQMRLWLITSNGVSITDKRQQLYQFHEQYFSADNPRIGNQVKDILVTQEGDIWLATIYGVIQKEKTSGRERTFSVTSPLPWRILLNNVYALEQDQKGRIWIGTAGGINIWDPHLNKMHSITANRKNGLLSNYISGFVIDSNNDIWVTAWEGGLFKIEWDDENPESMLFRLIDPNGDGRLVAKPGIVYYGSTHMIWAYDINSLQRTPVNSVNKILQNHQISALLSGRDESIWIGTSQELIRYFPSHDSIVLFPVQSGRQQKLINLREDLSGNIWATTTDAILKFSIDDDEQVFIPIHPNSPMKGFYQFCSDISPNGHILFGGDNGYIAIDPDAVKSLVDSPQVFISGLLVNNQQMSPGDSVNLIEKDISFAKQLWLKHNQNSVTFEFSTLDYLFTGFSQFQYRMLPVQENWELTSGVKNFAVFANLKPGKYTFEVKGSNRYGLWSEAHELFITISPSIWLSKFFLVLYFLLATAISIYVYRVYSNRRRLRNELQIIRLEKQHSEALYQAKIRFFTNISHEFRTPLSLIIPPIQQLIKDPSSGRVTQEKLLNLANRNAQRLYKLVNQLLDFRKIEADKLELVLTHLDIVSFCREIFNSFDDMAVRNEIEYVFTSQQQKLLIEADFEKIETIVFNLLSNAFKYTPINGKISLDIKCSSIVDTTPEILIVVTDTGIGIAHEEQAHIFEQFYQTTESKSLKKGSGIGLTLAQEYARLHKGQITVQSEPGKGSTFVFTLPYQSIHTFQNPAQEKESTNNLQNHIRNNVPTPIPTGAKKIAIIDDNEDILEFIGMNLREQYYIGMAKNGMEGLVLIENMLPDLVISDVMMPIMDGIELCQKIKENKATMHIPVILLTARSLEMQKTEGINKGADLYVTKPFDMDYLMSCITGIFRRQEQMEQYIKTQLAINPKNSLPPENNQDDLFIRKVMALIEHNISDPELSVELLADALGFSTTHLYRKLKEITGFSTKEIIMNYRMQKAAAMIANNEGNISDVMYAVGFSSLSGFSRSFKAKFGVPPTAFQG